MLLHFTCFYLIAGIIISVLSLCWFSFCGGFRATSHYSTLPFMGITFNYTQVHFTETVLIQLWSANKSLFAICSNINTLVSMTGCAAEEAFVKIPFQIELDAATSLQVVVRNSVYQIVSWSHFKRCSNRTKLKYMIIIITIILIIFNIIIILLLLFHVRSYIHYDC